MSSTGRTALSTDDIRVAARPDRPPLSGVHPRGAFRHAWCAPCDWLGPGRRADSSARADLEHHLLACDCG